MDMTSQHQIFQDGHILEKFNILKTAGDSQAGDLEGLEMRYFLVPEHYLPLLGVVKAVDDIVQAAFTRTVGADNGKYFSLFYRETYIQKGRYPTKTQGDLFALQDNFRRNATFSHPCLPHQTKNKEKNGKPRNIRFPLFCLKRRRKELFFLWRDYIQKAPVCQEYLSIPGIDNY